MAREENQRQQKEIHRLINRDSLKGENMSKKAIIIGALIMASTLVGAQVTDFTQQLLSRVFVTGGSIDVNNLPEVQGVSGTVDIGNLPSTQSVTGAVSISNLPPVQEVMGTVEISNMPNTTPKKWVFVGVTSVKVTGGDPGGVVAKNALCDWQYPGSRMAYTHEYTETMNPSTAGEPAWIRLKQVNAYQHPESVYPYEDFTRVIDPAGNSFSGVNNNLNNLDCGSWLENGEFNVDYGVLVDPSTGVFSSRGNCTSPSPVACAAQI